MVGATGIEPVTPTVSRRWPVTLNPLKENETMTDETAIAQMVPKTLGDLIAALEAAAGPSHALDDAIEMLLPDLMRERHRHYTASIDAALTLVPDATAWAAGEDEDGTGCADIPRHRILVHAATPAIALCIAALRARTGATP
jgi:hypothetical protein